jgi:hypothetical protein
MTRCLRALLLALATLSAATGPTSAQTPQPPREMRPGQTGTGCFKLTNRATFWIPGHAELHSRERVTFRLNPGETREFCLAGTFFADNKVFIMLKNALTWPVFSCFAPLNQTHSIFAQKQEEGYRIFMTCR